MQMAGDAVDIVQASMVCVAWQAKSCFFDAHTGEKKKRRSLITEHRHDLLQCGSFCVRISSSSRCMMERETAAKLNGSIPAGCLECRSFRESFYKNGALHETKWSTPVGTCQIRIFAKRRCTWFPRRDARYTVMLKVRTIAALQKMWRSG